VKKLKHESELFKAALLAGVEYAEGRKAVEFEATDSASDKHCMFIACWCTDKVIAPMPEDQSERENDSASAGNLVCAQIA